MDIEALKALADERRLAIVSLLAERGESCVCDLAAGLDLSDALVSHHVARLSDAGLVSTRRVGRWLHCSLDTAGFTALADELAQTAARAGAAIAAGAGGSDGCCCATTGKDAR